MRTLWIVAMCLIGVEGNLFQFARLIDAKQEAFSFFKYISYGCYCGWGGQGTPKDATDRCCFVHDCCYARVKGCNPKLVEYSYGYRTGKIVCENYNRCKRAVCECDRVAAICLGQNVNTYNKGYMFLSSYYCRQKSEQC
uniref:Basic phospholipase A2 DsM-b1/DsM-b1' n=1 Tax=Daboia siamensis TaxID=343250 RepID=PA2B1_DABSI|nr:RecName: Full=Basic phospholipase A2 DsM-b1/DsM-b1'; Short=svPLA2; AltName: Full=Phosphatidylcholine 2-acylhydrolase; Flags: Precursor [Daboia siamensis]AAZ53178.1 basic phospholipase A2 [Daboia siamensis]